jgi:ABC-type transport system involved in multi-copper enzyme maturation permease subunit
MLTLIAREIRDNLVSVALPCLVSALAVILAVALALYGMEHDSWAPLALLLPVLLLAFCGLGASQMYGDRTNRISSLLSTLRVTRRRIFAARVLAGVLTILVSLVPLVVTAALVLWAFVPAMGFYRRMGVEIALTVLLTAIAFHAIGLLIGWTTSKAWLLAGNVLLMVLVLSLVAIKGFGPDALALLLVFIGAALLRAWQMFASASL